MCIIIYKPKEKYVAKKTLARAFEVNPDGWGMMFAEDGVLYTVRGMDNFEQFWATYTEHVDKDLAIHMRITTHGVTNLDNTHPHVINQDLAVMHNGVLTGYDCPNKLESDTKLFARELGTLLEENNNVIYNPLFQKMLDDYVGFGSKLLFMDSKGQVIFTNKDRGIEEDGVWFSNASAKTYPSFGYNKNYNYKSNVHGGRSYEFDYEDYDSCHSGFNYSYWEQKDRESLKEKIKKDNEEWEKLKKEEQALKELENEIKDKMTKEFKSLITKIQTRKELKRFIKKHYKGEERAILFQLYQQQNSKKKNSIPFNVLVKKSSEVINLPAVINNPKEDTDGEEDSQPELKDFSNDPDDINKFINDQLAKEEDKTIKLGPRPTLAEELDDTNKKEKASKNRGVH